MFAYVGGYSAPDRKGRGDGINVYRMDQGGWVHVQTVPSFDNPSFLRIGPDGRHLYAMHGGRSDASAYAIDAATGELRFLKQTVTGGVNPVDFGFAGDGRHMVIAHYTSGSVSVLPVAGDGTLGEPVQVLAMSGTPGPHADQKAPMPHGVTPDPTGRFMVIPDKGLDTVFVFRLEDGVLSETCAAPTLPGAGPRHAAFHPTLPLLFVVCELDCCVQSYRWEAGVLTPLQSISALAGGVAGSSSGAEVAVCQRFVYASVRGDDSIARFSLDAATGLLELADNTGVLGEQPRFFAIDPTGRHLHVTNQNTDGVVSFPLGEDGRLLQGVVSATVGTPTVVCFQ